MRHNKFDYGYLKSKGIDIEEAKKDYGCFPVSHYDFYGENTGDKR